jgi:hypothetical protein
LDSLTALNVASSDSLSADSLTRISQTEQEITPSDTVQVSLQIPESEQKIPEDKTEKEHTKPLSTVKEPLWNPRKRK